MTSVTWGGDLGLISILRAPLETLLGEVSGGCTFLGELLADEGVFRHFWSGQCRNLQNLWCSPSPSSLSYWPHICRRVGHGTVHTVCANRFTRRTPRWDCRKTVTAVTDARCLSGVGREAEIISHSFVLYANATKCLSPIRSRESCSAVGISVR
jgi:hypothetical protein